MQTLKLIIRGDFYDSQIYAGHLYLWTGKGSIITVDWEKLIDKLNIPDTLKFAAHCAFLESDNLYNKAYKQMFKDAEILALIKKRFADLAVNPLVFTVEQLERSGLIIGEQKNPFPFPHADTTVYKSNIYVGSRSGITKASRSKNDTNPIRSYADKLSDLPALSIAAAFDNLAVSAGDEGLYSFGLHRPKEQTAITEPKQLEKAHSNQVRWMFGSIFSSSYFNSGFLADYKFERDDAKPDKKERTLLAIRPANELINNQMPNERPNQAATFSWGVQDKLCYSENQTIKVVQYDPYKEPYKNWVSHERFRNIGIITSEQLGDSIVRADSALFGYIVEGDDGLLVISSLPGENGLQEESQWLEGEPVNWRVFPNSDYYTNQLHVIYDDYLCIHSFNQDYFVDQVTKKAGISHITRVPHYSKKASVVEASSLFD